MPASQSDPTPGVVLDTNAVLDWLLFRNPGMNVLAEAIERGAVRWLACARMREELATTLTKPLLQNRNPDSERILTTLDRWTVPCRQPQVPAAVALQCTDPDDQVFIDLAVAEGARWLVTRDRALLRLGRRAARRGLIVAPPERWAPDPGP